MIAVPAATPITVPVEPTVATAVLLLLHVPPDTEFVNVVKLPAQNDSGPVGVIAAGAALTVTVAVERHVPSE